MEKSKLKIRDLTLRDGQQSLFATRMNQQTIDRLLPFYENAGYYIMEVWGGAVPDSVMRYLGESPWDRLRKCSDAMKGKSLLSALSRGRNLFGYVPYPDSVLEGFYKEAIANGLNVMRIFDALNDIDNVRESIKMINNLGGIADGAVCYTVDPKDEKTEPKGFMGKLKSMFGNSEAPEKIFTDEYFVTKAKEMEALGAKIITLKDMAGLVNPLRAASIISALKRELSVPVDFHTHCTPGYGLASSVMAMIHGVDILDTNIWWFGGGSAAPAIELIYIFAQRLGIEVDVNMEAVGEIRNELLSARKELSQFDLVNELPIEFDPLKDTLPEEISRHFDEAIKCGKENDEEGMLEHCHAIEAYFRFPKPNELVKNAEVPGGMYSNMVAQLKSLQADDVLDEAMALIPKVRRDAGLVPLVTPTSQIVGSQAVFLALDRKKGNSDYSNTSNQFMSLIKGEYGKTPVAIDPAFREKITGDPVEHPYDVSQYKKPENPVLEEFGGVKLAANDEEYLLLELLPAVANGFLRNKRAAEYAAKQAEEAKNAPVEEVVEEKMEPITGEVLSGPMPGTILEICVKPGDSVKKGDKLLVYESMKMENDVEAEHDAVIKRIFVKPGDRFAGEAPLIEFQD
ncbi:MAG: carboxylase [Paramuribaculum sp.]|nr:carboxylase [Paramuribaculum sp.]